MIKVLWGIDHINKSKLNFIIDVIIGISFIIASFSFKDYYIHALSGIILTTGVLIHTVLHWKWITIQTKKMFKSKQGKHGKTNNKKAMIKINYLTDSFIGIMFFISTISGLVLFFSNLTFWTNLHRSSSFLMVIGVFLHVSLHWKWILNMTRNTFKVFPDQNKVVYSKS